MTGFRWFVSGLDLTLGLGLIVLGVLIVFGHSSWHVFVRISNGWIGLLLSGYGFWLCFSGIRFLIEQPPVCWRAGKRRHGIAATLSGLIIVSIWLAMMAESAIYSPDGFGSSIAVLVYTMFFGCVIAFQLIGSFITAMIQRKWRISNLHDS